MGKKYSGRRPEDQPMYVNPVMLDYEKRRLYVTAIPAYVQNLINFIRLKDTPDSYSGEAGKVTKVNVAEDALEFALVEDASIYSQDHGLNWADLGEITDDYIHSITYLGNGIALLGDWDFIWRSIDFGLTWTKLSISTSEYNYRIANLGNGIVVFGDGDGQLHRSADYGLNWTDVGPAGDGYPVYTTAYLGNGIVICGDANEHVRRSTDFGLNWTDLGIISTDIIYAMAYLGNGIALLSDSSKHLYRSVDYGANWTDLGALDYYLYSIAYLGNGVALLGGLLNVLRSTDYGLTWTDLGEISGNSIRAMVYLGNGVVVLGDDDRHIFRSTDYGYSWTDLGVVASADILCMADCGNGIVILGDEAKHVYRSTSAFQVWQEGVRKANDVEVYELAGATYDRLQDYINFFGDRTLLSGGTISAHGDADGSVAIAACTAWCKESDSDTAVGKFVDYAGKAKQTLTDNSVNAIYLDYNGGTPQIVVATNYGTYGFQQDHILLSAVYRQGTTVHIFPSSNLGIQGINRTFMHEVEHHGAHRSSGLVTSDGGSLALSITTGVLYAGTNRHTTTVDGSTWSYWWTDDSGSTWNEDTGISALVQSYNNIASGKVSLGTNRFGVHWVYADIDGAHLHIVYGQGNYNANQAEEAGVPSVLPSIVVGYCVLIAKIINQEGSNTLIITYPWTTAFVSSLATDHNSLANLPTGNVHTQYILHALATAANDFLVASGSGAFIKKTLAEVKTLLGLASNVPAGTAENDFIVAAASPFAWVKKTLAEVRTLLLTNIIDKTHLSQDFGAGSGRLLRLKTAGLGGDIFYIGNLARSAFSGLIHAAGTGGLTATNVPYDNDSHKTMFTGITAYNGSTHWGKIILHNVTEKYSGTCDTDTTNELVDSADDFTVDDGEGAAAVGDEVKNTTDVTIGFVKSIANAAAGRLAIMDDLGNDLDLFPDGNEGYSIRHGIRKIEDADIVNDFFVTESSTDDWADNDSIDVQSQVNVAADAFDVDLSDKVAATDAYALFGIVGFDRSGGNSPVRILQLAPFTADDAGKRVNLFLTLADIKLMGFLPLPIINQKITMKFYSGNTDTELYLRVSSIWEYADT
jgi:hypothetical protein